MVYGYRMKKGRDAVEEAARLGSWGSAEEMAYELGVSIKELEEMWHVLDDVEFDSKKLLNEGYKPDICKDVAVIVHGRLFINRCKCYRKENEAYITETEFEKIL